MKLILSLFFLLFSLFAYSECLGGSRSGGGGMRASKYNGGNAKSPVYNGATYTQTNTKETNKTISKAATTKRNAGISAWGIIAIVLSVILFSVGSYYTFIFYPLLCKKERNYDVIELSNV